MKLTKIKNGFCGGVLEAVFKMLFCGFNGIQVFLAPLTMLYLVRSDTMLSSITSLLSFRIHFFPLIIFLIILFYMLFMLGKLRLFHHGRLSEYIDKTVDLNLSILTIVLIALIFYAVTAFIAYFYGIRGALKPGLALLFKLFTSLLLFYHYALDVWAHPFHKRGYGSLRSYRALQVWVSHNKLLFIRFSLLMLAAVLASVRVFQLSLNFVILPVFEGIRHYLGLDFRLSFVSFNRIGDVFINLLVLVSVFFISNLIFYPIVYAVNHVLVKLNPIRIKEGF
jgi:hypothetical protein